MSLVRSVRKHWFSVLMYVLFSAFFLVASLVSTATYVSVIDAKDNIGLSDPTEDVSLLPNGTLLVTFSVGITNPSSYDIALYSVNWEVTVANGTSGPGWLIPVAGEYWGTGVSPVIDAKTVKTLDFSYHVSDPDMLSRLKGYVNYSNSHGASLTLETVPYGHRFSANGWLGDFEHEYLREFYLNDLVRVSLDYDSRWLQ